MREASRLCDSGKVYSLGCKILTASYKQGFAGTFWPDIENRIYRLAYLKSDTRPSHAAVACAHDSHQHDMLPVETIVLSNASCLA